MSTALETPSGQEVAKLDEQALAQGAIAGIDSEDLVLPVIKILQQLSREVTDGGLESGHFVNTVTGRDYGTELEFVVVGYSKGRFYVHNRDKDDERTFVASGTVAPDTWPSEYAGQAFADIPDAEEQWKARSNAGEIEWGKGPPIVTTHNFVGLVVDDPDVPARIGLSRTSAPAAKKILTLMRFSNRAPWASTVKLALELREIRKKPFYVAKAEQGSQTPDEVVEQAKRLAFEVQSAGAFALTGEEVEEADKTAAAKPKTPKGGIDV